MFRLSRIVVALASLLFIGTALFLWVAPSQGAARFGLEFAGANGQASLRADLGGLFAGMAVMCAVAAWTGRSSWSLAAASVLASIAVGRALGWIVNLSIAGDLVDFVIEVGVVFALLGVAKGAESAPASEPRRRSWRRTGAAAALVVLASVAVGAAALLNPKVEQRIFDRAAQQRTSATNTAPLEDDAMRIAICGSSAPLPSQQRAKACVSVFAGGKFYLVDVGPESVENLVLWGIPMAQIGGVLLTHFHSDHIGDLGELNLQSWAGGRPAPLAVYGGPGVDRVVEGFNGAYRIDQGYRTRHHGEKVMPPATWPMVAHQVDLVGPETAAKDRTALVLEDGALRITAVEVDHTPIAPAYGYRFDYKGRSVLITGDTKYLPSLAKAAKGVDVLVSEAISVPMTRSLGAGATAGGRSGAAAIMHDIEDYHITPEQAASIANEAGVKLLAFYHLLPAPDSALTRRLFAQGISSARRGDWTLASDGSLYTLPIGSARVEIGRVVE
jgi:ribonuclease Z